MAKHGPTVLCFQCFCSIFLCWTWISQNWFAKHGHLSSKKCMKCIVFMFFKFWHMFSVLWDLQMHEKCFLLAQHVISMIENCYFCFKWQNMVQQSPTFLCFQCFVQFFKYWTWLSRNQFAKYGRLSSKKTKNVSFSCKCLQFLQEKHVLWVSAHILWTLAMLHTNGFYWQFQVSYANHSGFLFWGIVL